MKKLFAILSLTSVVTLATQQQFIPADNTKETQLCVAAIDSDIELKRKAKLLNVDKTELSMVACNKTPLDKFAKQVKKHKSKQYESESPPIIIN